MLQYKSVYDTHNQFLWQIIQAVSTSQASQSKLYSITGHKILYNAFNIYSHLEH